MLTPKDILEISEPIEAVYQRTVDELLINIAHHFNITGWERTRYWEIKKLSEMGALTKESAAIIAKNTQMLPSEIEKAFLQVSEKACLDIDPQLREARAKGVIQGVDSDPTSSILMRQMVQGYADQAIDTMNMVNTTMLESTRQAYLKGITTAVNTAMIEEAKQVLESEALAVTIGTETRVKAIRKAMNALVNTGITGFYDRAGRAWSAEAYAAMVVRTTAHNAAIQAVKTRQQEAGGGDIFQVSTHAGARPLCYPYQGKFFSWSTSGEFTDGAGQKHKYDIIDNSSYGEPAGLFGINCGHHPIPMIPNFSYPQDKPIESEEENRKEYEESQKQRAYERQIREAKRDVEIAKATGDAEAIKAAEQKVAQKQAQMRAYTKETGRPRRYDREKIAGTKDIDGYRGYRAQFTSDTPLDNGNAGNTFRAATTYDEGIKEMARYADKVNMPRATVEQLNDINEELGILTAKYPINKYRNIVENNRMKANARACYDEIEFHLKYRERQTWQEAQTVCRKNIDIVDRMYGDNKPADVRKRYKMWVEMLEYERGNVTTEYGLKSVVAHEYAHTLSDQYFGMINGVRANKYANAAQEAVDRRALVRTVYHTALRKGDIKKLSYYAKTNADEFLAEAFAAREMGEDIPKYISDMIDEVFNGRVTVQ